MSMSIIISVDGKDRVTELMMPGWIDKGQNKLCDSKRHRWLGTDSEPEVLGPNLQHKLSFII